MKLHNCLPVLKRRWPSVLIAVLVILCVFSGAAYAHYRTTTNHLNEHKWLTTELPQIDAQDPVIESLAKAQRTMRADLEAIHGDYASWPKDAKDKLSAASTALHAKQVSRNRDAMEYNRRAAAYLAAVPPGDPLLPTNDFSWSLRIDPVD